MKNYRDETRKQWGTSDENEVLNRDQLNTGCLLRIADAVEKMASNYTQLQNSLENYKKAYESRGKYIEELRRSKAALKGQITRLKNKAAN